ncbi:damage-inducible protein DinB [Oculatella sp. LEGE 06141]|nr:damage-inducible protein DinB [Oculatella sp. LEGE 06141]
MYTHLATYNRWANNRLYQACALLDTAAYYQNRSAFFGSIHGTLNHILLADRIWMARFTGKVYPFNALSDELYDALPSLQHARQAEDDRILAFVQTLAVEAIVTDISYANSQDIPYQQPLWQGLTHFFNHQTHHRGQVHQMLGEANLTPPGLDMVMMFRETTSLPASPST